MKQKALVKKRFKSIYQLHMPNLSRLASKKLKAEIRASREHTQNINEDESEKKFTEALKIARATAKKYNITQEDIDTEILALRAEKKSNEGWSDEFRRAILDFRMAAHHPRFHDNRE